MTKQTIIVVTGMPGVGKTTLAKMLAEKYKLTFIDKDHVCDKFTNLITSKITYPHDKESKFYKDELRDLEYEITMDIALEQLRYKNSVIVIGPFTKEITCESTKIKEWKYKIEEINNEIQLKIVNVVCSESENKKRINSRLLPEDKVKLNNWGEYYKERQDIDYSEEVIFILNNDLNDAFLEMEKQLL
jgi:dephospho-CoA kinase